MVGDKLVPELLKNALETPGSMLDNLNRMEKWDLLDSVVDWVEARNLQNQLVHEYMQDPEAFSQALHRARELVPLLTMTYDKIHEYAEKLRLGAR
jgi:3-methyladenine DNA glycosylase AlkD